MAFYATIGEGNILQGTLHKDDNKKPSATLGSRMKKINLDFLQLPDGFPSFLKMCRLKLSIFLGSMLRSIIKGFPGLSPLEVVHPLVGEGIRILVYVFIAITSHTLTDQILEGAF